MKRTFASDPASIACSNGHNRQRRDDTRPTEDGFVAAYLRLKSPGQAWQAMNTLQVFVCSLEIPNSAIFVEIF
jgi:hypothetical protein